MGTAPASFHVDKSIAAPLLRYPVSEYEICGVYFLYEGDRIHYIGKSVSVLTRVIAHRRAGVPFDNFGFIRVEEDMLDFVEQVCIRKYAPIGNRQENFKRAPGAPCAPNEAVALIPHPVVSRSRKSVRDTLANLEGAHDDTIITVKELSEVSGFAEVTLRLWRRQGRGPECRKIEGRPRYTMGAVRAWLNRRGMQDVSEDEAG